MTGPVSDMDFLNEMLHEQEGSSFSPEVEATPSKVSFHI